MQKLILILISLNLFGCEVDFSTKIKTQKNNKIVISTDKAPAAVGPYSQGILIDKTLYLAGQIALDPSTRKIVDGGIKEQTERVMENLGAVLNEAGYDFGDVVQSQVFISDMKNYRAMNEVYTKYFNEAPPARAAVETVLFPGALIEIMMTAQKP
ncbi:MAG: Rid family detoxifying hydrolase [Candidatus Neomarinimicrobiota bacterium]|nr:Rid family detoxifying hydrolase [Candidatus Neomarinimicrobiota bacterium]